jgi:hypothetical protein
MSTCYQTAGQNMLDHGNAVWRYTQKIINSDTSDMRIPTWYSEHKESILSNLHDIETIRLYNIYHDCGKHICRTIDETGKVHYPNHAEASKKAWVDIDGDPIIGNLIGLDMIMHTKTKEEIKERNLPIKDVMTLLITSLAELHANAEMFGGIDSVGFKIKFKKIEKIGKFLCDQYFNHSYVYVIVRKDLSPAQKAVQSSHACIEVARTYIKPNDEHPSVIICEVRSEDKLKMVMTELEGKIQFKTFQEPDIGNQFTALASEPIRGEQRKLFNRFQLIS